MPKALNMDNPKQAKRSSGNIQISPPLQPRSGLNYYVVPTGVSKFSYPELRFACLGLSGFDAFGVL